jgi:hypothetical protein
MVQVLRLLQVNAVVAVHGVGGRSGVFQSAVSDGHNNSACNSPSRY